MKNCKALLTLLSALLILACVQFTAVGQTTDEESKLAAVSASGSMVRWQIAVPHSAITMTVSAPDGQVFRREFKAGAAPEFVLFDNEGNKLADGQYNYELRFTPAIDSGVKQKLADSRVNTRDDASTEREMRKRGVLPAPLTQSGTFTILKGSVIVAGSALEGDGRTGTQSEPVRAPVTEPTRYPAPITKAPPSRRHHRLLGLNPDQVIPDDLIVQGSLCVGFDCVNNESFGFDTIRLKENNTRIKFDDTSTSAGFPANDWQLTANDSASGGASKFSIEDITGAKVPFTITAGAATNSMFVDSIGRVGMRTSTPVLDLHINTSNTPAIRLEQNNSGGFSAQTWDVAGNEANFFVRDVTGGSRLSLRIRPGAPTSSIDVAADGNVGIGTGSPASKLHVTGKLIGEGSGTGNNAFVDFGKLNTVGSGEVGFQFGRSALTSGAGIIQAAKEGVGANNLSLNPSGGFVGIGTTAPTLALSVSGDANKSAGGGSWQVFSDERLKTMKGQFTSGLNALMKLQPIRYEYKKGNALGLQSGGEQIGFGAQALQEVIPEAVTRSSTGYLQVNNDPILWTMLNAIKEQQKEIEGLKAEVKKLKAASQKRR